MNEDLFYKEGDFSISELKRHSLEGNIVCCGHCGTELVIALTDETAKQSEFGRGVFCPKDLKHVNIIAMAPRPSRYKN
jgi:hypothetical protein